MDGKRPVDAGRPVRVAILSHQAWLSQDFQARLEATIAGIGGADPQAFSWIAGSQAQAAQGASVCLLLAWDSKGQPTPPLGTQVTPQLPPEWDDLQAHQQLRQDLQAMGQTFAVLRGPVSQQLQQALAALSRLQAALKPAGAQTLARPGWRSACESCDEPECEHRLLTGLLKPG